jgi:NAD(P)-dependent dehydrogenase (short-subunit alcohol dehydrogenase family)
MAASPDPAATRTCVVTGASSGIGRAVAGALAARGLRVVMVCRDRERGERARREITAAAAPGGPPPELVVADLAPLAGVRAAARALLERCPRLDVLVHNAGVWPVRLERTADGLEVGFAVNHLAPFVLNQLLAERLAASAPARVVQVSAGLYVRGRVDLERTPSGGDFGRFATYATTKLCNLLATLELARRLAAAGRGVTVNAVHPGVVRTKLGALPGAMGVALRLVKLAWATPARGAEGPVRLATDPALDGATGRYFDRLAEAALLPPAEDAALAHALWQRSLALGGLA